MVHHYGGRPGFALLNAEFTPDGQRAWRWVTEGPRPRTVVKFELLTDQDDMPRDATVTFDGCDDLGAAEINVTGLAGFLLAKAAAARSRRKPKDWYDIAYVLLHNDAGGPEEAATAVLNRFGTEIEAFRTNLADLQAKRSDAFRFALRSLRSHSLRRLTSVSGRPVRMPRRR